MPIKYVIVLSGVTGPLHLPRLLELITGAVLVLCFRMQISWLEYSQLHAG